MAPTELPLPDRLTVLKLLADGQSPDFAAQAVGMSADDVVRLASGHGYPDRHKLAWAADIIQQRMDADAVEALAVRSTPATDLRRAKTTPRGPAPRPSPPHPVPGRTPVTAPAASDAVPALPGSASVVDGVRGLIARGGKSERVRTQRLAAKAEAAITALERALQAEEESRRVAAESARARARQRAEREAEERKIRAELAELERRREMLRRQLRPGRPSRPAPAPREIDPKKVRQWAHASGVDVPATGRVPVRVVELYLAASPNAA